MENRNIQRFSTFVNNHTNVIIKITIRNHIYSIGGLKLRSTLILRNCKDLDREKLFLIYVVTVPGEQRKDSVIHMHVSILPQTLGPSRLPHNNEPSSMCYTVSPCWLFILNIAECTCLSQTP